MDHLISPKLTPGVHCVALRHKGMFVGAVPDPEEEHIYDTYEATWYWCAETQTGFGPDGQSIGPHECKAGRRCCKS